MKKTIFQFTLILTSLTLSLFIANSILTAFDYKKIFSQWDWLKGFTDKNRGLIMPYVPDTKLIYKLNTNLSTYLDWVDTHGFREKPSHHETTQALSVVMVGDSFTFGEGVKNNEAYPFQVEKLLQENGVNVVVYNAGVAGYGADQEFVYIKDYIIPLYHPTIIVWNFNINDVVDSNEACLFSKNNTSSYTQLPAWRNTLFLSGFIIKHSPGWLRQTALFDLALRLPSVITHKERYTFGCTFSENTPHGTLTNFMVDKIKYFLSQAQLLARKNNLQIVTTLVPFQLYFDSAISNQDCGDYYKLRSILNNSGLMFLDTNELIAKQRQPGFLTKRSSIQSDYHESAVVKNVLGDSDKSLAESMFLIDNWDYGWRHLNAAGNMMLANVVADKLQNILMKK